MTLSALLAYRYAGRSGTISVAPGTFGRIAARVAGRLRPPDAGPPPTIDDRARRCARVAGANVVVDHTV